MKLFAFVVLTIFLALALGCSDNFDGKNGTQTVYFPDTKIVKQIVEYKDGKLNGIAEEFFRNENLKSRQHFLNDTIIDSSFFYHKNGNIAVIQLHSKKGKEGCWKYYNTQGKLYKEICYKNNILDSTSSEYTYRTGRLLNRFNFKEGSKEGKQESYYNNGKPKYVIYYKNGQHCLETEEWYESGEKINNDFKIKITEQNKVQLQGSLKYFIELEKPQKDDQVYCISKSDSGNAISKLYAIERKGNQFVLDYSIGKGHFLMETLKIGAFRKTKMGNTVVRTAIINIAAENY